MKKMLIIIFLMSFVIGTSSELFAQQGQRQGGRGGGGGGRGQQGVRPGPGNKMRPGNHQREAMKDLKKLERLRMMKLLDLLELNSDVESELIPHIRKHHKQMFQLMKKHQSKIAQLAKGLRKDNLSDEKIIERIKEIDQLEIDRHEKIREFHMKASNILTAEQLGKLYVFQARFGGEVLEKMQDFRKAQNERLRRENGN